jgi:signal transduction histidine kinase
MKKQDPDLFAVLNTPLKIALICFVLAVAFSEAIAWFLDGVFSWHVLVIAGTSSFFLSYTISSVTTRYRRRVEAQNRQLEELAVQLQEANDLLGAHNAELDAFGHTVAHDLKNPLTTIMGLSQLLEIHIDRIAVPEARAKLQQIGRVCEEMAKLIDDLMLLSHLRQTEVADVAPLDMALLVERALDRLAPEIRQSGATVIRPETWPEAAGYGPWVEQAWVNYISNALKYGGQPPRVELGAEKEGEMARFWVQDNGAGLDREAQQQLFTPFTRLSGVEVGGHGLGLSIVRRIVQNLGGEAGVESAGVAGAGCTFYFTLPRENGLASELEVLGGQDTAFGS